MMPNLTPIEEWSKNVNQNPPPTEIIEDILFDTNEINGIVGRSEIGKTNFCNQIGHCLANQQDFIGQKVLSPQSVGYIGFEVEQHQFAKRNKILEKHIPASPLLWVDTPAPFFKLSKSNQSAFQKSIEFAKVVIIDPVRYIVPGDYLEPKVVTEFMQRLQEVIRVNKQLAIIVLYFKKLDSRSPREPGDLWSIKGATEWGDMCSTVLMLERTKQGHRATGGFAPVNKDAVTLYFAKTRNAANIHDPINLLWNRQKCMFEKV
jgi:RecA-family ATPase